MEELEFEPRQAGCRTAALATARRCRPIPGGADVLNSVVNDG